MKSKQVYKFTSDKLDIAVWEIVDSSTFYAHTNTRHHEVTLKDSRGNVERIPVAVQSGKDIFESFVTQNGFVGYKLTIFELLDDVVEQKLNPYNDDIPTEELVKIYEKIIMKKLLPKSLFKFEEFGKNFIQYDFMSWSINEFGRLVILYSNDKKFVLDVVWDEIVLNMKQWYIEDLFKWESTSLKQEFGRKYKDTLSSILGYEFKLSNALDVLESLTEFKQKQSWE